MLLIRRIEIENFVCFDNILIEPSTDRERPLTVIRAENAGGKTSLLRAIRWGMYGEDGLPDNASQFSLHPADWNPDTDGILTKVAILFETDGSSRDNPEGNPTNTAYEVTRTVKTVAQNSTRKNAPDFRRVDERAQLMIQEPSGAWRSHEAGVAHVVSHLLPSDLKDFFVMDADEAADFVGGSENKIILPQAVIEKTSIAVRSLLGLDVFEDAKDRVEKIADEFGRAATRAVGNDELNRQQQKLDEKRNELAAAESLVHDERTKKEEIEYELDRARDRLEAQIGSFGAQDELKQRLKENRTRRNQFAKQRKEAIGRLSQHISGMDLLASLVTHEIAGVRALLQPMYDDGSIPSRHIAFVQSLIERGVCVCGQELRVDSDYRQHVQYLLDKSQDNEGVADYLADVLQAANGLHQSDGAEKWESQCREYEQDIAGLDEEVENLDTTRREIDSKLDDVLADEVQDTRNNISMLETNKQNIVESLARNVEKHEALKKEVHELEGRIRAQVQREREAQDHQACQQTAKILVRVLEQAYTKIQDDQVSELNTEMRRLFAKMAANVSDEDFGDYNRHKASLRMIQEVGLQRLPNNVDKFEIFAHNHRGRPMPPTEINGASRRILALSFVLALCKVSKTHAPLVADSLLNFMSGSVRSNTLQVTAETASQSILLLTGSDLESQREVDLVAQYADATYTLTGQWLHTSRDGDVVNLMDNRNVALICSCGPREFCNICERVGQSGNPGWQRRVTQEDDR